MALATLPKRLTRPEAAEETRRRVLDAARAVFLRNGFHGTTVDAVAAEAGFTKGAVYSRFASKADLFLALYEERQKQRALVFAKIPRRARREDLQRAIAESWTRVLQEDRDWLLLLIEFWTYAARDDELRQRFAKLHEETRRNIARSIEEGAKAFGDELALPSEEIALAHMALGNGFALEVLLDPTRVEAYQRANLALARGMREQPSAAAKRRKEPRR
ncbi:MAG TPA: TetR/AcrR family transcriptional regulator [Candidatus Binatia bacterium]